MRRIALMVVLAAAAVALASDRTDDIAQTVKGLNGSHTFLGVISSTDGGAFTNATTPAADGGLTAGGGSFDAGYGARLLVQCTADARLAAGGTPHASWGLKIEAIEKYYLTLKASQNSIGIKPTAGTACIPCCSVFRVE